MSDFQLIIAKAEGYYPNQYGVALLSSIGYFPGNITLFREIKSIPYLETLSLDSLTLSRNDDFVPFLSKNNDNKLIKHLTNIVPKIENSSIALSGGLDSRFLLGIINNAKIKPQAYTLSSSENEIVKKICEKMKINLKINNAELLNEYKYTLMSDGRIYFRGGNYSSMCFNYSPSELLHVGIWSDPTIENAFKSSWKFPAHTSSVYGKFIWHNLLQRVKNNRLNGLSGGYSKMSLFQRLKDDLDFQLIFFLILECMNFNIKYL